jgi:hypothetical protein
VLALSLSALAFTAASGVRPACAAPAPACVSGTRLAALPGGDVAAHKRGSFVNESLGRYAGQASLAIARTVLPDAHLHLYVDGGAEVAATDWCFEPAKGRVRLGVGRRRPRLVDGRALPVGAQLWARFSAASAAPRGCARAEQMLAQPDPERARVADTVKLRDFRQPILLPRRARERLRLAVVEDGPLRRPLPPDAWCYLPERGHIVLLRQVDWPRVRVVYHARRPGRRSTATAGIIRR